MATETSTIQHGYNARRLNCFAFPSDTASRFFLLILATVGSAIFLYSSMFIALPGEAERAARTNLCAQEALSAPSVTNEEIRRAGERAGECYQSFTRRQIAFTLGSLGGLALVAGGFYLLTPPWKIRRRRLVPLCAEDAPEVVATFNRLCAEAGLAYRPTLLWNPLNRGGGALAFGRAGRYYVAVGAGLVTRYYLDRDAVTAVLRHELSHFVNRDVNKTYLTMSIWWAFLVVALLPFAIYSTLLSSGSDVSVVAADLVRAGLLTALVYLTRNAALRAREYYADVRASLSDGPQGALGAVLQTLPTPSRWQRLAGLHPDPAERQKVISRTARLFRLGPWDALAAGAVAGVATSVLSDFWRKVVVADLVPVGQIDFEAAYVVVGLLLGIFVGIGVWRATFAARALDEPLPHFGGVALALTAGLVAGESMSFSTGIGASNPLVPSIQAGGLIVALVAAVLLLVWLRAAADAWLDAVPVARSSRAFSLAVLVPAGLWAWAWNWVGHAQIGLQDLNLRSALLHADYMASHAGTVVAVTTLVVVPVAAVILRSRRHGAEAPEWAFLESSAHRTPWPRRARFQFSSAVLWGASAGALFFMVTFGAHAADLWTSETPILRSLGLWEIAPGLELFPEDSAVLAEGAGKVGYLRGTVALSLVVQLLLGVIVATRGRRGGELPTVFASVTAGLVMALSVIVVSALHGGTPDLNFVGTMTMMFVNPGVFVAVTAAAVTVWTRRRFKGEGGQIDLRAVGGPAVSEERQPGRHAQTLEPAG